MFLGRSGMALGVVRLYGRLFFQPFLGVDGCSTGCFWRISESSGMFFAQSKFGLFCGYLVLWCYEDLRESFFWCSAFRVCLGSWFFGVVGVGVFVVLSWFVMLYTGWAACIQIGLRGGLACLLIGFRGVEAVCDGFFVSWWAVCTGLWVLRWDLSFGACFCLVYGMARLYPLSVCRH